jgi:hypothetical protein
MREFNSIKNRIGEQQQKKSKKISRRSFGIDRVGQEIEREGGRAD